MATEPFNVYARYGNKSKDDFYHDAIIRVPNDMWKELGQIATKKYHTSINALMRGYIRDGLQAENLNSNFGFGYVNGNIQGWITQRDKNRLE